MKLLLFLKSAAASLNMRKNPLKKRENKSKEQLAYEMKVREEAERQKRIVKEVLYPALKKHATSIQHAQRTCEIFKTVIMQAMQLPFKDKQMNYLNLKEELTKEKDVQDKELYAKLIDGFDDVAITDTLKLLEGMGGAIDGYIRGQTAKQPFDIKLEELVN